jgi:carbonic anhydrase
MLMKKLSTLIAICALLGKTKAAGTGYDYHSNGADWPDKFPDCAEKNQSPIDLKTTGLPIISELNDRFNKLYTDQTGDENGDILVEWKNGQTVQVAINKEGQDTQIFSSSYSKDRLGATDLYTGVHFNFHAGSEHTIDGKRYDLEMHTYHLAQEVL